MNTNDYHAQIESVIRLLAPRYGVDPDYAVEIARLESGLNPYAVGDKGKAVGLWQWWYESWVCVRRAMGLPVTDRRDDVFESTITALYALGVMKLDRWWSTAEKARKNITERGRCQVSPT